MDFEKLHTTAGPLKDRIEQKVNVGGFFQRHKFKIIGGFCGILALGAIIGMGDNSVCEDSNVLAMAKESCAAYILSRYEV